MGALVKDKVLILILEALKRLKGAFSLMWLSRRVCSGTVTSRETFSLNF